MALNALLNTRIGWGSFHTQSFLVLCLVDLNDGVELVLSSFLNPIIRAVFPGTTSGFLSLLASIFYIGILSGSFSSGMLADIYGRRRLITWGACMQIGVSLLFYLAESLNMMLFLRFLYGYAFGFTVAITTSMFAEISPEKYRGKGILLINFCISFGKLYAVVLGYFFLESNLAETNWKLMMVCGSLPNCLVLLGSLYILEESPRYLMAHQRYDEAFQVLDIMLQRNHNDTSLRLGEDEKKEILSEFEMKENQQNHQSLSILFNKTNLKVTLSLSLCWIVINFCFYGQLVIEAFHLGGKTSSLQLKNYFLTIFGEIPSLLLSFYLIDHPQFGRKKSLAYFFLGAAICHLSFSFSTLVMMGSLARFFMKDVFQILYPLTTQSFSTGFRTKGFGFCSGSGRLGAILMPFVLIPMDSWSRGSVYVLFSLLCLSACAVGWSAIEETMNKGLDESPAASQLVLLHPMKKRSKAGGSLIEN